MISVVTPSVRPENLEIIGKCLRRQTHKDYEWLIIGPEKIKEETEGILEKYPHTFIVEPPKKPDDYYALCKAMNLSFARSQGELVVMIQDGMWFPPDMLSMFWAHFEHNPKALVTAIGHQYSDVIDWKPENMVWKDPRARMDHGSFYEVAPSEMEMAVCSMPKQALLDAGGIDEEYDKGAAVGEKEMCWRLDQLGYKFYIDQTIEYRAVKHPRLNTSWDDKYKIASDLFIKHYHEIVEGKRQLQQKYIQSYLR